MAGGLRRRLGVLLAVASLPLVLYVGYQIVHLDRDLTRDELAATERGARLVSVSLNRFVHQMVEQGQSVGLAVVGEGFTRQEADAYVRSLGQHAPVSNFNVLTPEGEILATALPQTRGADLAAEPAFTRVLDGAPFAVSQVRTNASGRRGFAVFAPVGRPLEAVVSVSVDSVNLGAVIPVEARDGLVLITDHEGTVAYAQPTGGLAPGEDAGAIPAVGAALSGRTSVSTEVEMPGAGEKLAGSQVPVPEIGWTAGFYTPASVVSRHVSGEVTRAIASVIAILLFAVLIARHLALEIVEPLEDLTAASERLRQGDFETPVRAGGPGEVGVLAEVFDEMKSSLSRTFASVSELAEAARSLNAAASVDEVADVGARHLASLLHADASVITLWPADHRQRRVRGFGAEDPGALAASMAERVGDDMLADRPRAKLLAPPTSDAPAARFLVSLPLIAEDERIGRADVIATVLHGVAEFERADIELAHGLAQQLATALENARRSELEREIAETLQDSLLTEPVGISGVSIGLVYRPASGGARVGGDFYDLIRIDERRVAFVLGDISGHGLSAAGATIAAKGALRSYALEDPSPSAVLQRANVALAGQLEEGRFVTVFYALLDTDSGELLHANAGHPSPTLLSGPERARLVLPIGDPPLGVDPAARFAEHSLTLEGGDALVAFTDGVTEARAEDGRFFGEEGVAQTLATARNLGAQELATALVDEAAGFAGRLQDDAAVLVVERQRGPNQAPGSRPVESHDLTRTNPPA